MATAQTPKRLVVALIALTLTAAGTAAAITAPFFSAQLSGDELQVSTVVLPKGWFSSRNQLDPSASQVTLEWSYGATTCSAQSWGGVWRNLPGGGDLTGQTNRQGNVTGWTWSAAIDVSSGRNTWWERLQCDGQLVVEGCPEAVPVRATLAIFGKNGDCREDDSGDCVEETQTVQLPALQLAGVVDTDCVTEDEACMGPCVSACTQDCNALSGGARVACKQGCAPTCQEACGVGQYRAP